MTYAARLDNRHSKKKSRNITLFEEHVFHQWVTGVWAEVLTASEYKVVSAIFARTVAWGKLWEIVPTRHLVSGIKRRDGGGRFYCGTGLSRRTIITVVRRLVDQGFLMERPFGATRKLAVNLRAMGKEDDPAKDRMELKIGRAQVIDIRRARKRAERAAEQHHHMHGTPDTRATLEALRNEEADVMAMIKKTRAERNAETGTDTGEDVGKNTGKIKKPRAKAPRTGCEDTSPERGKSGANAAPITREHTPSVISSNEESNLEGKADKPPMLRRARKGPAKTDVPKPSAKKDRWEDRKTNAPVDVTDALVVEFGRSELNKQQRTDTSPEPTPQQAKKMHNDGSPNWVIDKIAAGLGRRKAERRASNKLADVQELWRSAVNAKLGTPTQSWTQKQTHWLRTVIRTTPLPSEDIWWGQVFDWVASDYGAATSLAVPFMVKKEEKRQEILKAKPSLNLVLRFAAEYLDAYVQLFHGEGFTPEREAVARADGDLHDVWMRRKQNAHEDGHTADLRRNTVRTDKEVKDAVTALARDGNLSAQERVEQAERNRQIKKHYRKLYGPNYRKVLQQDMVREQHARNRAAAEEEFGHMFGTQDMTGDE